VSKRVGSRSVFWLRDKSAGRVAKPSWPGHPPGCVHLAIKLRLFCRVLPAEGASTAICPCVGALLVSSFLQR
jgi:hypothetical protein